MFYLPVSQKENKGIKEIASSLHTGNSSLIPRTVSLGTGGPPTSTTWVRPGEPLIIQDEPLACSRVMERGLWALSFAWELFCSTKEMKIQEIKAMFDIFSPDIIFVLQLYVYLCINLCLQYTSLYYNYLNRIMPFRR